MAASGSGTLPQLACSPARILTPPRVPPARSGTLPADALSIAGLRGLRYLHFTDFMREHANGISGTISSYMVQNMNRLLGFEVEGCAVSGTLPAQFGAMTRLGEVEIDDSLISGTLPASLLTLNSMVHMVSSPPTPRSPAPALDALSLA